MDTLQIQISIIIPVYNRPNEIDELLGSLVLQTDADFEVIIVEDGSEIKCDDVVNKYSEKLVLHYFFKENSGPGQSRNYGCERASGSYFIFLDSDCLLHENYVSIVRKVLSENYVDAFGGPDRSHESFTNLQKAISYSMTSFFTTGGIRGGGEKLDKFFPRSFNMGFSREVYEKTRGFSLMRFGEDIDMSIRILGFGFKTRLIKEAYVFHKRRNTINKFYKQVFNSGVARINLYKKHPGSLKLVHLLPSCFTFGVIFCLFLFIFLGIIGLVPLFLYALLIFVDSGIKNRSIAIGGVSITTSYVQLMGYGLGFLYAFWRRILLSDKEFSAFKRNFYK